MDRGVQRGTNNNLFIIRAMCIASTGIDVEDWCGYEGVCGSTCSAAEEPSCKLSHDLGCANE